jgi:hypothetical protein
MLSSAASVNSAQGSSPEPRTTIEVAEPLRPLLVGREDVPDEIDRRPLLRQGGAEIAAREIAGRRRRSECDLALGGRFIEASPIPASGPAQAETNG